MWIIIVEEVLGHQGEFTVVAIFDTKKAAEQYVLGATLKCRSKLGSRYRKSSVLNGYCDAKVKRLMPGDLYLDYNPTIKGVKHNENNESE